MMPSPDALTIANAWLDRETQAYPALGKLLARVPQGLFGPEPKRVSIEHWKLIEEKASKPKPELPEGRQSNA